MKISAPKYFDFFRPLGDVDCVLIDLEATGGNPKEAEIIEVAALHVRNGEVISQFASLIRPRGKIPRIIQKITGIDYEIVKDAPSAEEVLPIFFEFIRDRVVISHNVNSDLILLQSEFRLVLRENWQPVSLCTHTLASHFLTDSTSKSLSGLALHLGIVDETETASKHRALWDAEITAALFESMRGKFFPKQSLYTMLSRHGSKESKNTFLRMHLLHLTSRLDLSTRGPVGQCRVWRLFDQGGRVCFVGSDFLFTLDDFLFQMKSFEQRVVHELLRTRSLDWEDLPLGDYLAFLSEKLHGPESELLLMEELLVKEVYGFNLFYEGDDIVLRFDVWLDRAQAFFVFDGRSDPRLHARPYREMMADWVDAGAKEQDKRAILFSRDLWEKTIVKDLIQQQYVNAEDFLTGVLVDGLNMHVWKKGRFCGSRSQPRAVHESEDFYKKILEILENTDVPKRLYIRAKRFFISLLLDPGMIQQKRHSFYSLLQSQRGLFFKGPWWKKIFRRHLL